MTDQILKNHVAIIIGDTIGLSDRARAQRILDVVEERAKLNNSIEMRDHAKGKLAFVLTSEDGTVRHWVVASAGFSTGQPRPVIPGAYWNPERPTEIYTLSRAGHWSHNTAGPLSFGEIPDGLQLLGAFE